MKITIPKLTATLAVMFLFFLPAAAQIMECDPVTVLRSRNDNFTSTDCKKESCNKLTLGLSSCTKDEAYYTCKKDLSDEIWIEIYSVKVDRSTAQADSDRQIKNRSSGNTTITSIKYENCRISSAKPKL